MLPLFENRQTSGYKHIYFLSNAILYLINFFDLAIAPVIFRKPLKKWKIFICNFTEPSYTNHNNFRAAY